jgi:hypothetical protein
VGIVVSNKSRKSKLYEFGMVCTDGEPMQCQPAPILNDLAILRILEEWRSGDLEEKAEPPILGLAAPQPAAREVATRDEFIAWLRDAKAGSQALYHRGSLAHYRKDAPTRLLHLQKLSDDAKPAHPRPPGEAIEMQQIQDRIELIQTVTQMQEAQLVSLIQRRSVEAEGEFIYLAIKKAR